MDQIVDDIKKGWSAPVLLIVISALMISPVTALIITVADAGREQSSTLGTVLAVLVQLLGTFWIAGYRLRRSGS
ncbi:MAG: hypothetical protein AAGH70_13010 [Pseudomonadota bacterium]